MGYMYEPYGPISMIEPLFFLHPNHLRLRPYAFECVVSDCVRAEVVLNHVCSILWTNYIAEDTIVLFGLLRKIPPSASAFG